MTPDNSHLLLYILASILGAGFFAGIEIAFTSANKLNLELRKNQNTLTGRILARFTKNPEAFSGTTLLGLTIMLVIYTLLMSEFSTGFSKSFPAALQQPYVLLIVNTFLATVVMLVFAVLLPKAIFRNKAESVLSLLCVPMLGFYYLLSPVVKVFVGISEFALKYLFNVRIKADQAVFSRVDMDYFIKHSIHGHETDNTEFNTSLFKNALYLVNVRIRKCLIPRREIVALDVASTVESLRQMFIETKLSRIILYEDNIDNIKGYAHHLDLNRHPSSISDIMHDIITVPEAMSAVDLMNNFTKGGKSIAWVIDEYGGTAGIVTMEDVLEEIFGEIKDEYDEEEFVQNQISSTEYILSGRLELDYLNAKFNFNFPVNVAETLSGYIIAAHESIPQQKDRIILDRYEFDILLMSETKIETVKMKVLL